MAFLKSLRLPALIAAAALTWTATVDANSAADYFVHELPGAPEGPLIKMHAGHIEITPEHNGNLFFWHFQNKHIANRQRTVIWLNGGPGCSSEDGAMMEIGPYRLKDKENLVYNDGSWHEFANLLFVDNPVGTGFSYVDTNSYVTELDQMANQFITFLEKWFDLFPEYEQDDLYIAGESFAGQHIPYIAKAIVERNKKPNIGHKWNLKNLIIGNGWIDPDRQYEAYLDFAYQKNLVQKDSDIAKKLEVQHRICLKDLAVADAVDHPSCEQVLQDLLRLTVRYNAKGQQECLNMYDVRLRDTYPSCGMNWPPDLENVTPYLRRRDVVDALHINAAKATGWVECNGAVGSAFRAKNSKASISFLPELLTEVPITLFSGAEDLICNHIGTESLISNMQWNGGKGFELSPGNWAPRRDWTVEGEPAGFWQEARNLTYVLFFNSSHMVPFDYPRRSRDMLDRIMKVDISSIGGDPIDSRIDGEPGPETTVGGTAGNTTAAQEAEKAKLDAAKWAAYQRSGEIVLVIVAIAAVAWGIFVWRDRRKRRGYQGLSTSGNGSAETHHMLGRNTGLENFRNKRTNRDIEAGDFDESELDDLHLETPTVAEHDRRYSVGEDSEDDDGSGAKKEAAAGGSGSRS
ncbi:putative carboxypeptidase kex1 protein [Phaeoacremonium minimum UCRPA7]|uniref:Pheromone-processing carboxypeptidase KEX1 n=1 Tax=Phaeoacremonium minimum (strain UCR-PA7) TaxID=1286976 RepID=R8BLW2_PHAM7|nr:putative carboxypeptidase kex1 protein [Phaeoacremonium minimum UCRPA7]EOO00356.1 putative carboxypeptidase kex1 protein [Phaeoacremonium minimum UCRPA7]